MPSRVALVTGAQQGIGAAIAIALADAGADVAINYLDDEPAARSVGRAVEERGRRALLLEADVSNAADVARAVAETQDRLGAIDILVNNAGIFPFTALLDITEREWDQVLDVNLKGAFLCAQSVARGMIERGAGGSIINMSSIALAGAPKGCHYVTSKGGLSALTRALALELAPHDIRVNAVAPGLIDTAQPRGNWSEEEIQGFGRTVPLGRVGQVDDLTALVVLLAGEGSSYITGQTIHVNGGGLLT